MNRLAMAVIALACLAWSAQAEAQLNRGTMRFYIDGDVLAIGGVKVDPEGLAPARKATIVGFGPNQRGNAHWSAQPTPIGVGFGYVLQHNLILGVRASLGYDVVSPDGATNNTRYLALALMPGVTFVPVGNNKVKLAIDGAPIFQVDRAKTEGLRKDRTILGGFALGVGALIFTREHLSADVGFRFEGRFGNTENDTHVRDLRGVIRLGVSFWR